jgi:hypothetical protein
LDVSAKQPGHQFEVGDKIRINMHGGKIVDAVIKAILGTTDGLKNQVDYYRNSWHWRRVEETQLGQQEHGLPFIASHPSRTIRGNKMNAATESAQLTFQMALMARPTRAIVAR